MLRITNFFRILTYIIFILLTGLVKNLLGAPNSSNSYIINTNSTANSVLDLIDTTPSTHDRFWIKGSYVRGAQGDTEYILENTANYGVVQAGVSLLDFNSEELRRRFLLSLSIGTAVGTLDQSLNNQDFTGYDVALQEQFFLGDYFLTFAEIYLNQKYKDSLFDGPTDTYNNMLYNSQFGRHFIYKYAVFTPEVFYTIGNNFDDNDDKFLNQEYGFRATLSMRGRFAPYLYFEDSENKQELYDRNEIKDNITTWAAGMNYIGKRIIINVNYSYEHYQDSSYNEGELYAGIRYNVHK
ncbi:hypothetical protein HAV_00338 [Candidatus Hepatincola sp. Av]